MMNMKLLDFVTSPSIYHGCSTRKTFWEEKSTGEEKLFSAANMENCGRRNVRKHREIKGSDKYVTGQDENHIIKIKRKLGKIMKGVY